MTHLASLPPWSVPASIPLPPPLLLRHANAACLCPNRATSTSTPGQGITGTVDGHRVGVGNVRLIPSATAPLSARIDEAPPIAITVADPIKATTPDALDRLRGMGLRLVMLTGDSQNHCRGRRP